MILKAKQLSFILAEIRVLIERWKEDTALSLSFLSLPRRSSGRSCTWKRESVRSSAPFRATSRREATPHND